MHTTPVGRLGLVIALGTLTLAAAIWTRPAGANLRPPAQPTAVATIDLIAVLGGLTEKQDLEDKLQIALQSKQAQLDELVKKLETIKTDLDSTLVPGTDAYKVRIQEFLEVQAQANARREVLQQILSMEKADMLGAIYNKIRAGVAEVAEREGFDAVFLDDSQFPLPEQAGERDMERAILSRTILYRHDSIDITEQVITLINNQYGASARP